MGMRAQDCVLCLHPDAGPTIVGSQHGRMLIFPKAHADRSGAGEMCWAHGSRIHSALAAIDAGLWRFCVPYLEVMTTESALASRWPALSSPS
jgi:hypothetical protein